MAAGISSILSLGQQKNIFSRDAFNRLKKLREVHLEHNAISNAKKKLYKTGISLFYYFQPITDWHMWHIVPGRVYQNSVIPIVPSKYKFLVFCGVINLLFYLLFYLFGLNCQCYIVCVQTMRVGE